MTNQGRPLLFVAREPDETLRVYLPVLEELRRQGERCRVLFHHTPGEWARERLRAIDVEFREVALPERCQPRLPGVISAPLAELVQLRAARALARQVLDEESPRVVVVVQDTLLLERFLVREANRRRVGTLVVQWAFTYPQTMYDLLNEIQRGRLSHDDFRGVADKSQMVGTSKASGGLGSRVYRLAQTALGVRFDLVQSYGGGEAKVFAVMGEAFREQFVAQGVHKERIEVTGHPLHDSAYRQKLELSSERLAALRQRYDVSDRARIILYATQPVLWRGVVTRDELVENVRALGSIVGALGEDSLLLVKLHPREAIEDYAPAVESGLPIRLIKDAEIAELIALCEAFISSSSSTVLLAMMLDRPIVTVNFNQVPHFDYFEAVGGTIHVRTLADADRALRSALTDSAVRERLSAERRGVLSRYSRFDGQATRRLANLVQELAATGNGAPGR